MDASIVMMMTPGRGDSGSDTTLTVSASGPVDKAAIIAALSFDTALQNTTALYAASGFLHTFMEINRIFSCIYTVRLSELHAVLNRVTI